MTRLKRIFTLLAVSSVLLALSGCCTPRRSTGFTPWMNPASFSAFLNEHETKRDDGKNFWARGHWITAVEGRWGKGVPEYRIKIGDTPKGQPHWWYWWFNQSQADFNAHIHRLSDQGFTLVSSNHFTWPDGSTRYSGVWQKTQ